MGFNYSCYRIMWLTVKRCFVEMNTTWRKRDLGPVVRSMVSANQWLSGIKINWLSWYLTLVSANHLGPVVRSIVSANHWLSSIKINWLSWYLTLVSANHLGPVARSMVSANHWLSSIKINRLSWYLTLVSANQASSNSVLDNSYLTNTVRRREDRFNVILKPPSRCSETISIGNSMTCSGIWQQHYE